MFCQHWPRSLSISRGLHTNLHANRPLPLMLPASCVNTLIHHSVFHCLCMPVAKCFASCLNRALYYIGDSHPEVFACDHRMASPDVRRKDSVPLNRHIQDCLTLKIRKMAGRVKKFSTPFSGFWFAGENNNSAHRSTFVIVQQQIKRTFCLPRVLLSVLLFRILKCL